MNEIAHSQVVQKAKPYMGEFAWPTVLLTALVAVFFTVNLVAYLQGHIPFVLAFFMYAALTYMAYTPLHEAAHNNIQGKHTRLKWLNDLCGFVSGTLIMVPYSTHTLEHFTHHRFTNIEGKDPDFIVKGMSNGLIGFLLTGFKFLWTQWTFLFAEHWRDLSLKEKSRVAAEMVFFVAWRLALLTVMSITEWLALLVLAYFVGAYFTAYWFAYRPHLPYSETERYKNTNSMIMPKLLKPIRWFWLGQDLHSIHHAFPRVPFYRYRALFQEIEPELRTLGNPVIGLYSRKPIEPMSSGTR